MASVFTYSIANDFPVGKVNVSVLLAEIKESSITSDLERIDVDDDTLTVVFVNDLSAGDKTTLDGDTANPAGGLIAQHDVTFQSSVLFPQEILMGSRTEYQVISVPVIGEIQYTKSIVIPEVYSKVKLFVADASPSGNVRCGIYESDGNQPATKIVEGLGDLSTASNNSFFDVLLDTSYEVFINKNIWIAVVVDTDSASFVSTDNLVSGFHPVFFEQTADSLLPATATPVVAAGSALYAALSE